MHSTTGNTWGGPGGAVIATVPVIPGETLTIVVGGGGGTGGGLLATGGVGGGGAGGLGDSAGYNGGGGGGMSGLRRVSNGTWLAVAGGGGGSGGVDGPGGTGGSGIGGVSTDAPTIPDYEFDTQSRGGGGTQVRAGRGGVQTRLLTFPGPQTHGVGYRHQHREFWMGKWSGKSIQVYQSNGGTIMAKTIITLPPDGPGQIMQIWWPRENGTAFYTANWDHKSCSKLTYNSTTGTASYDWTVNVGCVATVLVPVL